MLALPVMYNNGGTLLAFLTLMLLTAMFLEILLGGFYIKHNSNNKILLSAFVVAVGVTAAMPLFPILEIPANINYLGYFLRV